MLKIFSFLFCLTLLVNFLSVYMIVSFLFFLLVSLLLVFPSSNWGVFSEFFVVDGLSYILMFLSVYITILGLLSSKILFNLYSKNFIFSFLVLILLNLLLLSFCANDLLLFYIYFEASLIPLLVIVVGYGNQPEKVSAGLYMLFYTVFGSLPLLLGLFYIFGQWSSLSFIYLYNFHVDLSIYMFPVMVVAFLIKLPSYLFHLWLPKAHVEAPVLGSMLLAGVMLKLGGYGLLRVLPFFVSSVYLYANIIIMFSLFGGFIVSLVCLSQSDLKSLVAYSSVSHMMMMMGGIFSLGFYGWLGSLIMMIAHGLTSSGLFSIINMVYERVHSRSLLLIRGLMLVNPLISLYWFILSASNMGAPPFLNLMGELGLSFSMIGLDLVYSWFLGLLFFMGGAYSMYFFSLTQHGNHFASSLGSILNLREALILFFHVLPLIFLFMKLDLLV